MIDGATSSPDRDSWLHPALILAERARLIALAGVIGGLVAIAVTLALPKKYTTTVAFSPVAAPGLQLGAGALAGLAGQFGVQVGAGDPSASPDFYATLLRSETILIALATEKLNVSSPDGVSRKSFIELYEISESDSGRTLDEAIKRLRTRHLGISFDRQTSIVAVSITTRWPDVSAQMGERLLALVDTFNLGSRRSKAAAEERFLGERLSSAEQDLRAAEDRMQAFLLRNRSFAGDPGLEFEHSRLQRRVSLAQGVYTSISDAYEQARLSAVRNTPSVSTVDTPTPALRFDRRHTLTKAVLGAIVASVAASLVILAQMAIRDGASDGSSTIAKLWVAARRSLAGRVES
jgi:uncharacterized protein involved in exopolysaccharide biosynthesis